MAESVVNPILGTVFLGGLGTGDKETRRQEQKTTFIFLSPYLPIYLELSTATSAWECSNNPYSNPSTTA
jgi:hypothetical protein